MVGDLSVLPNRRRSNELTLLESDIIRISPNHVHINDPDFYHRIYKVNSDFLKDPGFYHAFGMRGSLPMELDNDKAQALRKLLNPTLAKPSVDRMAEMVYQKVRQFSEITLEKKGSINIRPGFQSLSAGIICVCCFGREFNIITDEDDPAGISQTTDLVSHHLWKVHYLPFLASHLTNAPNWMKRSLFAGYHNFREQCVALVQTTLNAPKDSRRTGIIDTMLDASQAGTWESPDEEFLTDQIFSLVFAGIDTSSITMTSAFYYILSSPDVLLRLQDELRGNTPNIEETYDWNKVRQLPYLSAIIKETLRISSPAPGRFPRIVPPAGLHHKTSFIPGGTVLSSCIYHIHQNPNLFPEPEKFQPERWLEQDSIGLEKYLVAFSKGSRSCPGIHLSYLEIYTVLAIFFSRFDMELLSPSKDEGLAWSDHGVAVFKSPVKVRIVTDHWRK
ncbi:hypothetical protein N7508_001348 [Penicillium antarcticum]|uniref:uncharacterized protein n=1 Tax=Penicillium antarcticum TaxID=416450 RepID=UPI0023A4D789|nr:uncharacterized protein N7508_001348 [Penicillium antarcticum]KAJ5316840.1 hypothetical protein N7508_001348 [Penicillium antarcticum]